jgi:8-oxo-dGTP pyrophosphatase MutT (NUDIX family)
MNLTVEEIRLTLQRQPDQSAVAPDQHKRQAAVLVPLYQENQVWNLLFTRRTNTVADHKGQVSFPGGSAENHDQTIEATALREAWEEIGLPFESVSILGRLKQVVSSSNYLITPIVGFIHWPFQIKISEDEVSRVFSIPLDWLANPLHHEHRPYFHKNGESEIEIFYQPYQGETVWGITASITEYFLGLICP